MTEHRDPLRLFERVDVDPRLRNALRSVSEAGPDAAQLEQLVEGVNRALASGGVAAPWAAKIATQPLWLKLGAVLVTGAATLWMALAVVPEKLASKSPPEAARLPRSTPAQVHAAAAHETRNLREQLTGTLRGEVARSPSLAPGSASQGAPDVLVRPAEQAERAPLHALPLQRGQSGEPGRSRAATHEHTLHRAVAQSGRRVPAPNPVEHEAAERQSPAAAAEESELSLIVQVQHALAMEPARALELLDRLDARFPEGQFGEERAVLRIDALSLLARPKALSARALRFLNSYPTSLHRARVQRLLDAARDALGE